VPSFSRKPWLTRFLIQEGVIHSLAQLQAAQAHPEVLQNQSVKPRKSLAQFRNPQNSPKKICI
jgi:hypothetical protein